ncbi:MAG: sigma-70 family RNA polymerase sigma factor [Phycisphaerales bacterium]|nr:sigma-70 family RNA polymerase sigma factor [Phycisphaerales bacterium]
MESRTDEQLLAAYRKGETSTFRTLIERHHEELIRFLIRLLSDRQAAEDVFQDTFLQIHQSAATFDTSRRFRPWLFTIAANKGRDYLRKKGRRPQLDLSAPVGGDRGGEGDNGGAMYIDLMEIDVPAPDAGVDRRERDAMVQQALESLPPALREILILAYFQRLSYIQIADELEIPLGTVKSRLHAAVAAFAKQWKILNNGSKQA